MERTNIRDRVQQSPECSWLIISILSIVVIIDCMRKYIYLMLRYSKPSSSWADIPWPPNSIKNIIITCWAGLDDMVILVRRASTVWMTFSRQMMVPVLMGGHAVGKTIQSFVRDYKRRTGANMAKNREFFPIILSRSLLLWDYSK